MNKRELIKKYNGKLNVRLNLQMIQIYKEFIHDLEQLDEPEKVKIPQFVADYIEFQKKNNFHVYGAMRVIEDHSDKRVSDWFYDKNIETFIRAWLDGYEKEKEKEYLVKIKANNQYLMNNPDENAIFFYSCRAYARFTRKELEKAGFGWVFNCPGIELEEMEE